MLNIYGINKERLERLSFFHLANIVLSKKATLEQVDEALNVMPKTISDRWHQDMFWFAKMLKDESDKNPTPCWLCHRMNLLRHEIAKILFQRGFNEKESLNLMCGAW